MIIQFILHNWYLFAGLAVVMFLLVAGPISQAAYGIKLANPTQAVLLMNHNAAVVVDVCEASEFNAGHIPNAVNLPLSQLKGRERDLDKHKDKPIIVTCRSGNRSMKAAVLLRKHGLPTVYNLAGGLLAWEKDNLPVEK
jgi:rhodanese-related sulfurtransferase